MDNQYNYYNQNGNYQYGGGQPQGFGGEQPGQKPHKEKKPHKGVPKAVAITGFARSCLALFRVLFSLQQILWGAVS